MLTTNVDAQFEKSGFARERTFATQGDYAYLQAASGQPKTLVYNEQWVYEAMAATTDCRIPTRLIPRHPETGEQMAPNLRCDDTFVEDEHWHEQARRCEAFVSASSGKRIVLMEFGVGFNTPGIIRIPFERMAAHQPDVRLIRFNRDYPLLMTSGVEHYCAFTEPVGEILQELV